MTPLFLLQTYLSLPNLHPLSSTNQILRSQIIFPLGHFGQYIDSSSSSADPVEGPASRIFVTLTAPPLSTSRMRSSILILHYCPQTRPLRWVGLPFWLASCKSKRPMGTQSMGLRAFTNPNRIWCFPSVLIRGYAYSFAFQHQRINIRSSLWLGLLFSAKNTIPS